MAIQFNGKDLLVYELSQRFKALPGYTYDEALNLALTICPLCDCEDCQREKTR